MKDATPASRLWLISRAWVFAWCAIVIVPRLPGPLDVGLDPSYLHALNMAWNQGMVFGRDFVFTYGPLAWLMYPDPGLVPLWAAWLYHIVLWAAGIWFLRRTLWDGRPALRICAVIWTCTQFLVTSPVDRLYLTLLALITLAMMERRDRFPWAALAAGAASGFCLVAKLNDGISGVAILTAALAWRVWRDGFRWPLAVAAALPWIVTSAIVGSALPSYLRYNLELASGYSVAMGLGGPMWQFLAGAAGVAVLAVIALAGRSPLERAFAAAPCLLAAFAFWKHAMVRHDDHAHTLHVKLAVAAILLAASSERARAWGATAYAAASLGAGIAVLAWAGTAGWYDMPRYLRIAKPLHEIAAWIEFDYHWNLLRPENRKKLDARRLPPEILAIVGRHPVEIVPYSIDLARANNLLWRPRPVIQTYSAYTPVLDALNAAHISGPRAAAYALVEWGPVDNRHPFLEDPLSMRTLAHHYDHVLTVEKTAVLRRRPKPRFGGETALGTLNTAWAEWTSVPPVPANGRRVLHARIRPSVWGRLRAFAFRLSPVMLDGRFASGRQMQVRVLPYTIAAGALLEGIPMNLADITKAFEPAKPDPDPLVSIRFVTPGEAEFQPAIAIEWSYLAATD